MAREVTQERAILSQIAMAGMMHDVARPRAMALSQGAGPAMPGMQGPELLKQAREYLGAAPVMFISGYAESEFSDLLEGERNVSFLPKPIDIKTLAERVKLELAKAA